MRQPTPWELLTVWGEAGSRHWVNQALMLLALGYPDLAQEQLEQMPIGQRDDLLLALRERMFGPVVITLVSCPACADRLELSFNISDIRGAAEATPSGRHTAVLNDFEVTFRAPNSRDLLALPADLALDRAQALLLERCVLSARRGDDEIAAENLPQDVVDAVTEAMEQADPLQNIELTPHCRSCDHVWRIAFDIVAFLMDEIAIWVAQVTREVHTLASRYGWSEAEILAMGPRRRRRYLELEAL